MKKELDIKCLNDGIDYLPQIYGYDDVDPGTLY